MTVKSRSATYQQSVMMSHQPLHCRGQRSNQRRGYRGYRLLFHVENGLPEARDNLPSDLAAYWNYRDALYVHDGVLMYSDRIVVPTSLRRTVANLLHSAHQGVSMMEARARSIVFWPRMSEDIKRVRDACLHCCRNAPSQAATPAMAPSIPSSPI